MIELEAAGQTVLLDDDLMRSKENVGIGLSGGADSALLFYLACKYIPDVHYFPWCAMDMLRPAHIWSARDIFQIIKERFPHVSMPEKLHEFQYNIKDAKTIARAKAHPDWHRYVTESRKNGAIKRITTIYNVELMKHKYNYFNMLMVGITAAPPRELCETWDTCEVEERRYKDKQNDITYSEKKAGYVPMKGVDKKWVAAMYKKEGLMDSIFPLTASCVGGAGGTKNFTEPCKKCFWCREKHWAFGQYDLCFINS